MFEGARLIVGDGARAIENAAFVVNGTGSPRLAGGQVQVPAGARRVDLSGKTVMPAIIDTHTHLPPLGRCSSTSCSARRTTESPRR